MGPGGFSSMQSALAASDGIEDEIRRRCPGCAARGRASAVRGADGRIAWLHAEDGRQTRCDAADLQPLLSLSRRREATGLAG